MVDVVSCSVVKEAVVVVSSSVVVVIVDVVSDAVVVPSVVIIGVAEDIFVDSTAGVVILKVVGALVVASEGKLELKA